MIIVALLIGLVFGAVITLLGVHYGNLKEIDRWLNKRFVPYTLYFLAAVLILLMMSLLQIRP